MRHYLAAGFAALLLSSSHAFAQGSPLAPNQFMASPSSGTGNLAPRPLVASDLAAALAGATPVSGIPFNPSVPVPSSFSAPNRPGILLTGGVPFYIAGAPTSTAQDTPAGTLYVSKNASYTGIATGSPTAIYAINNIAAGVQGVQLGALGYAVNSNTLTSQPGGTSAGVGMQGIGACNIAGCTATWGGVFSGYDTSGQANPTNPFYGLEVDNYAHGTDSNNVRIGIQIVANTPDQLGTLNTVGRGLFFSAGAGAHGGQFGTLVDAGTVRTTHGMLLANAVFSAGAASIAYSSPAFQVNGIGDLVARTVQPAKYTVATLPVCNAGSDGQIAVVTDLNSAPTYNTAIGAGGGANETIAFCRNSTWTSH